ncbi:hypothetical protein [Streptomyces atriruber]|uniref:hypothetical protein n=1 Tax=Streptomyces atriruber TaxID=545121 RepID=UPI000A85B5BF|nr:hypothetical protein [Streptomyces atriruber]
MNTLAEALRWAFICGTAVLLVACITTATRKRSEGASWGTIIAHMENKWLSADKALFAIFTGYFGSRVAEHIGGSPPGTEECLTILFPLGVVAAVVATRLTVRRADRATWINLLALVAAPIALGAVTTGW